MIDRMPPPLRALTKTFIKTGEFSGKKTPVESGEAEDALIQYEDNLESARLRDNSSLDLNPALGVFETNDSILEYRKDRSSPNTTEYYTASKGGPMKISTYSRSSAQGLDIVLAVTDDGEKGVFKQGAIHLDREHPEQSFFAGDLEDVPRDH